MGVVEMAVTGDLRANEVRLLERLRLTGQLHLGHHEPVVVAMKLVHLKDVVTTLDEPAVLVDDTTPAELQQVVSLVKGYLFLKLITRHPTVITLAFDGKIGLIVTDSDAHRSALGGDISLSDMTDRSGGTLIRAAVLDKEFTFYFKSAHFRVSYDNMKNDQIM